MNKLRWILIIVLALVLTWLVWRWRHSAVPAEYRPTPAKAEPSSSTGTPPLGPHALPAPASIQSPPTKGSLIRDALLAVNHKELWFYGKVVDQNGTPLAGVAVGGSYIYNTLVQAGTGFAETTTNGEGLFAFSGIYGRTLGIDLEKPGYVYTDNQDQFHYTEFVAEAERHHPDSKNPVVFVMNKLQGAEPMIHFEQKGFDLPTDGTAVGIDLATGKKVVGGGDLVFQVKHAMAAPGKWLQLYPWSVELSAGSGLIEKKAKYVNRYATFAMNLAPETGYVPQVHYAQGPVTRSQDFEMGITRSYYLKTSDGRYARLWLTLTTQTNPDRPTYVSMTWWLNPKPGSRNLEFDPAKLAPVPKSKP
ncbi:hypothetical protein [Nibricoccus sp. IMCC34717]|uniref:carboxypeptidase-like regulatory domain-containing protein n=1 Tax=Nibricoccus sp. IMCC34717 TaxID=3034021 RepID=UPI00384F72A0